MSDAATSFFVILSEAKDLINISNLKNKISKLTVYCHCEERSDAAIPPFCHREAEGRSDLPRRGFQLTLSKHLINKNYIYGSN